MTETKDNIHQKLLSEGRKLVCRKGAEYLTARKLSDATGYSVGTIYNQFANMDNFILEQNSQTLSDLYDSLKVLLPDSNPYINLNRYVDAFVGFVLSQPDLWFLLFNEHLKNKGKTYPLSYRRKLLKITDLWKGEFQKIFRRLTSAELKVSLQVLWLSLFGLSAYLTQNNLDKMKHINKQTLCQLLLNTYLAGLSVLRK